MNSRIAILDGGMGTTISSYGMTEADICGNRFKEAAEDLVNNGDLFTLTQPGMIGDIHRRFLEAGADIIETNTFGATTITQSEFFVGDPREHGGRKDPAFYQKVIEDPFLQSLAWEINKQSARQCREWPTVSGRPRDGSASSPEPSDRLRFRSCTRRMRTIPASARSPSMRSKPPSSLTA